jgi:geranylgeranyl pyrophosphate synthase
MAELLEQCDIRKQVEAEASELTTQAFNSLVSVFPETNDYSEALYELTGLLLNRKA